MAQTILIECPHRQAVVNAVVSGAVQERYSQDNPPCLVSLVTCPKCGDAVVGVQEPHCGPEEDESWGEVYRVWPSPPTSISGQIPSEIRKPLQEAEKCLRCKAYTASVGMSGRALEAIGRHFNPNETKPLMLGAGLKKLREANIIDSRLYDWGEALAKERNLAAHASGTHFNRSDAEDILKFTTNICEYVFVLSEQFKEFMERRKVVTTLEGCHNT